MPAGLRLPLANPPHALTVAQQRIGALIQRRHHSAMANE
jgi:hypothetical protein